MATGVSHLPHITNVQAGINRYDPMYQSVFEVSFTLPDAISSEFANDITILTEQVTQVDGLDALQKTVQAGQQKFLGVDVSFLNTSLDNTYAELNVQLNLNLREGTDAYVLKIFKAWEKLGYNLMDGTRTLKKDYICETLRVAEAARNGDIWRSFVFHDVLLTGVEGLNELNYTNNEARTLTVHFRSDYWDEEIA
jgi:hypothetical protein